MKRINLRSTYLDKEYASARYVREYLQERSTGRPSQIIFAVNLLVALI